MTKTTDTHEIVIKGKDAFGKVFKKLNAGLSGVRKGVNSTQVKVGALVGIAGLGALVTRSLQTIDVLAKTADRLDVNTEKLAGMQHAAEQTGASAEALNMGLQRMVRRIGQVAAVGKGEAKPALDLLGISIDDIKNKRPDEQFALIAEKMSDIVDQGQRVFITQKLFDSEGVKLLNTLQLGADGLKAMQDDAEKLGIAVSRIDAAKIEAANDAIDRSEKAIAGIGNDLTIKLAPIIKAVADDFTDFATQGDNAGKIITSSIEVATGIVGAFADGLLTARIFFKGLDVVASEFARFMLGSFTDVIGLTEDLGGFLDKQAADSKAELNALILQDLPSVIIEKKIDAILATAEIEAEKIAEKANAKARNVNQEGEDPSTIAERQAQILKLERLDIQLLTERERIEHEYQERLLLLEDSLTKEVDTEGKFAKLKEKAEKEHNEKIKALDQRAAQAKISMLATSLGKIISSTGGRSKKLFKIQKAAAMAQVGVELPAAIVSSFEKGGGYPWGVIPATLMAAAGLAELNAIKNQSFNGGSGRGSRSFGGSGGGIPSTPAARTPNIDILPGILGDGTDDQSGGARVEFHFHGDVGVGTDARKTLEAMKEIIDEEDFVFLSPTSRNGLDLADAGAT